MKILAINPGSTSTKVALYEDDKELWSASESYPVEVISSQKNISERIDFRYEKILQILDSHQTEVADIDAFAGRGGLLHPLESGAWLVNDAMLEDIRGEGYGVHASNLGAPLAHRLALEGGGKPAYIVDPVVVDERISEAAVSGVPEIPFRSIFHALNQRAVAHRAAKQFGKQYGDCCFVVAHLGGGVSVGAHRLGRVIDVNQALGGSGPMSPERAGTIPAQGLVDMCFSGEFSRAEINEKLSGRGGLAAHLGTTDFREVVTMADNGDERAKLIFDALCHQVGKEIGAVATVLRGKVDAIIITGGLARNEQFCRAIEERVSWIAELIIFPGEDELRALAEGVLRVSRGDERAKSYEKESQA